MADSTWLRCAQQGQSARKAWYPPALSWGQVSKRSKAPQVPPPLARCLLGSVAGRASGNAHVMRGVFSVSRQTRSSGFTTWNQTSSDQFWVLGCSATLSGNTKARHTHRVPTDLCGGVGSQVGIGLRPADFNRSKRIKTWHGKERLCTATVMPIRRPRARRPRPRSTELSFFQTLPGPFRESSALGDQACHSPVTVGRMQAPEGEVTGRQEGGASPVL